MMKLRVVNGVLLSSLTVSHRGNCLTLKSVIIDTGSAHTWVNLDSVEDALDVVPEAGDHIITAFGIGGRDIANRKQIDRIQFADFTVEGFQVDFGRLDVDLDGLIGLDLLTAGKFVINLAKMEICQDI